MVYISYDNLWRSEFYSDVYAKDILQDITFNQLKLKVNNIWEKDEEIATKFEASIPEDVISRSFFDTKLAEVHGHISYI